MKFFLYILESEVDGSFYVGQTNQLNERIVRHNKGYNKSTKNKVPWKLVFSEEYGTRSEAYRAEQKLKGLKKRESIIKYIKNRGVAQSGSEK